MTTSGVNSFNLSRNEIIYMALEEIGVKTFNHPLSAAEVEQAAVRLNTMIKSWKNKGLNLWKSKQGTLFTNVGQAQYTLDGITANATQSYSYTTTTVDALSGGSTITLDDATGFSIGYYIGVMQGNNTSLWTTISNIVGNVITLTTPLTADTNSGSYVFAYQTKIKRPEGISAATLQLNPTTEVVLTIWSNNTYYTQPVKTNPGITNTIYYNKQLNSGIINLWPIPNVNSYFVNFTYQEQYDDFITPTNTPDFPPEWLRAIYLNLARELLRSYGKSDSDYSSLIMEAEAALADCEGYDREDTSIYIQPASVQNIYTYR